MMRMSIQFLLSLFLKKTPHQTHAEDYWGYGPFGRSVPNRAKGECPDGGPIGKCTLCDRREAIRNKLKVDID